MSSKLTTLMCGALVMGAVALAGSVPAVAGNYNGNFMIRLQATDLLTQDQLKSLDSSAPALDLKAAGYDAKVSDVILPTATLTYFLNKNLAVELLCCFSQHSVELYHPSGADLGSVANAWIFPPALTLQYHIDAKGFKPYVGAGLQYVHFFGTGVGDNPVAAESVSFSDAWGPIVQAGVDVELGKGFYLNADVKKSWLDTTVTWHNSVLGDIEAKDSLDPLVVSLGIGYRFDLFK